MSNRSNIEWTDATWNPVTGCTKVSDGCKNCYAESFAERFRGVKGHPYEQGFDLRLWPERLDWPLKLKKPSRIFVNSMSDLFQEDVPDEFIDQVFGIMGQAKAHTFQILTKRPQRMHAYLSNHGIGIRWARLVGFGVDDAMKCARNGMPNVWLGVSVENQATADERIPILINTPAAVRVLSVEPMLEAIDLGLVRRDSDEIGHHSIGWVIVGGESGPGARPCDIGWIRSIVRQCKAADVPVFVKQWGSRPYQLLRWEGHDFPKPGILFHEPGADPIRLRARKGGDPSEWPKSDRIREYPR